MAKVETDVTQPVTGQQGEIESTETPVTGVTTQFYRGLYRDIGLYIDTYIYIPVLTRHTVTLWIFHTWLIDHADVTPYLHILAPEKQSGKTTLMDLVSSVTGRPITTAHMTAAAMRRALDSNPPPTLLFDEIDPIFTKKGEDTAELRAVINAGFRRGAQVTINVRSGKDWALKAFSVFSPKVLVSIGRLPDTIESRSIPILLERMPRSETRKRFRYRESEQVAQRLRYNLEQMQADLPPNPVIPSELNGRQADIWEPLLAIAEWLGEDIAAEARKAAISIHSQPEDDSPGTELLRHIKQIFDERESTAIYSQDLVDLLLENEEWEYVRAVEGKPLDTFRLASLLKPFGIKPTRMRLYVENTKQARGYYRLAFEAAWDQYL